MRRLRIQCSILIILAFLSIISVGFASWVTTTDSVISSVTGTIQVDDIIESNEYITKVEPTSLKYYKTGFVSNDGEITQTGTMSIALTINIDKCKSTFKNATSFNLYLTTTYSDSFNLFNNSNDLPVNISIGDDNINQLVSNDIATNGNECTSKIVINDLSKSEVVITIYFSFTNNKNTFTDIYKSLKESTFKYSAKITSNDGE